ncbi:hypothetical protein ABN028_30545 [Actinopolymorpha sp. B17G11]|uniref:hypothetical protein n=1 Tax=Actinopolymorpha sp. B17G11 TaxID=3160861 RepID=UPI0032E509DD
MNDTTGPRPTPEFVERLRGLGGYGLRRGDPGRDLHGRGAAAGFAAMGADAAFAAMGADTGFAAMGADAGFAAMGADAGFAAMGSAAGLGLPLLQWRAGLPAQLPAITVRLQRWA